MKDLKQYLNEAVTVHLMKPVQDEAGKDGAYQTFAFTNEAKKYKKGFIYINIDDEYCGMQCMNSSEEYEKLVHADAGTYKELDNAKIGVPVELLDCTFIRVW